MGVGVWVNSGVKRFQQRRTTTGKGRKQQNTDSPAVIP